jgi:RNA polymerase sigma factor (sigma-70 family)
MRIAGRSPLLRLQSDERLVALTRAGNQHAYEALVHRYEARLLAFCRHMLGSREDAEDVLQESFAAAFNALGADDRDIAVKPWLYRIARNRCLNQLRRAQAIGVDSMDVHFADGGITTADHAHRREDFRLLVEDVHGLAESQRTALVLREMEALSYDQIAQAMDTTVPAVKSLLVRARVSLAEAAESRRLTCDEVRLELGERAEGLTRKLAPPVRRHLRACDSCAAFRGHLRDTNKALAALFPVGPLLLLKKLAVAKLGHAAGAGGGAAAGGGALAGGGAAGYTGGLFSAGFAAVTTKAAAGLAAAAVVTAGAVEVDQATRPRHRAAATAAVPVLTAPVAQARAPARVSHPTTTSTHVVLPRLERHVAAPSRSAVQAAAPGKPAKSTRTAAAATAAKTGAIAAPASTSVASAPVPSAVTTAAPAPAPPPVAAAAPAPVASGTETVSDTTTLTGSAPPASTATTPATPPQPPATTPTPPPVTGAPVTSPTLPAPVPPPAPPPGVPAPVPSPAP